MITPEQLQELEKLIKDIALGVYNVALRQVYVDAIVYLIALIGVTIVSFIIVKKLIYFINQYQIWEEKHNEDWRDDNAKTKSETYFGLTMLFGVLSVFSLGANLICVMQIHFIVTAFANPNWILITRLIDIVK